MNKQELQRLLLNDLGDLQYRLAEYIKIVENIDSDKFDNDFLRAMIAQSCRIYVGRFFGDS